MVKIIPANLTHLQELCDLEQELFKEKAYMLNSLREELQSDIRLYLVAINEQNEVIGYVGCALLNDVADVMKIGVKSNYQRLGIATSLIKELIAKLGEKHIKKVMLEVSSLNAPAIEFYESIGFVKVSTRKDYYKKDEHAYIYILTM